VISFQIDKEVPVTLDIEAMLRRSIVLLAPIMLGAASPEFRATVPHAGAQAQGQGRLILRNITWESVRVDVRIGKDTNCEMNASAGERVLRRGRVWAISSSLPICWRRELAPGGRATRAWTPWTRRIVPPGRSEKTTP
jgi:hypothetical protein